MGSGEAIDTRTPAVTLPACVAVGQCFFRKKLWFVHFSMLHFVILALFYFFTIFLGGTSSLASLHIFFRWYRQNAVLKYSAISQYIYSTKQICTDQTSVLVTLMNRFHFSESKTLDATYVVWLPNKFIKFIKACFLNWIKYLQSHWR